MQDSSGRGELKYDIFNTLEDSLYSNVPPTEYNNNNKKIN
jgi:hypothetical protein